MFAEFNSDTLVVLSKWKAFAAFRTYALTMSQHCLIFLLYMRCKIDDLTSLETRGGLKLTAKCEHRMDGLVTGRRVQDLILLRTYRPFPVSSGKKLTGHSLHVKNPLKFGAFFIRT
jgi:hypothetical protein